MHLFRQGLLLAIRNSDREVGTRLLGSLYGRRPKKLMGCQCRQGIGGWLLHGALEFKTIKKKRPVLQEKRDTG